MGLRRSHSALLSAGPPPAWFRSSSSSRGLASSASRLRSRWLAWTPRSTVAELTTSTRNKRDRQRSYVDYRQSPACSSFASEAGRARAPLERQEFGRIHKKPPVDSLHSRASSCTFVFQFQFLNFPFRK